MATPITNEKRLDDAQKIIEQVLKDVRNTISQYNESDYRKLLKVWANLTAITLRQDI